MKDPSSFPISVEKVVESGLDEGFDGVIVCVNKGEESSLYSAGWDNRAKGIQADPHSLFKIASISKLYLAAAAAKLVADDKLSLESSLAELIPEVEGKIKHANEITLKMMIQHRSGIIDYSFEAELEEETYDDYLSFAKRIYGKPADFKPNKKYSYSNTNYLLLGEILDRTLGYSHHDYIQNEILNPLGLVNTYNVYKDSDTNEVMSGYIIDWEPDVRSWDFPLPGGNMVATAEDVGIFLRALIDGTLLTKEEQEIYSSIYEYEHTGWLPGYTSIARYHPDIDAVIVQFVNTSHNRFYWMKLERFYDNITKAVKRETSR